jgi:hypothetical protein
MGAEISPPQGFDPRNIHRYEHFYLFGVGIKIFQAFHIQPIYWVRSAVREWQKGGGRVDKGVFFSDARHMDWS